jgi:hypothetical protein
MSHETHVTEGLTTIEPYLLQLPVFKSNGHSQGRLQNSTGGVVGGGTYSLAWTLIHHDALITLTFSVVTSALNPCNPEPKTFQIRAQQSTRLQYPHYILNILYNISIVNILNQLIFSTEQIMLL